MSTIDITKAKRVGAIDIVNATPHPLHFLDAKDGRTITVQPCGATLLASKHETVINTFNGVTLVQVEYHATAEGDQEIAAIARWLPAALIVGSIISAAAYLGAVVSPLLLPGYERVPNDEKRCDPTRFALAHDIP